MEGRGEQQLEKLLNRFIYSGPMGNDILQSNQLSFDYVSNNEVSAPSWRTGEILESKRTELLMRSYSGN